MFRFLKWGFILFLVAGVAVAIRGKSDPTQTKQEPDAKQTAQGKDYSKMQSAIIQSTREIARDRLFAMLKKPHTGNVPIGTTRATFKGKSGDATNPEIFQKPTWRTDGVIEGENVFGAVDRIPFSVIYVCGIDNGEGVAPVLILFDGKAVFKDERYSLDAD